MENVAMKKVVLAMGLAMVLAAAAQAMSVTIEPSATTVNVGDMFTIEVLVADATEPVEMLEVFATFDPALMSAEGAAEGGFIESQGGDLAEFVNLNNGAGTISYTVLRMGPAGSTGSGTGATFDFLCQGAGTSLIDYRVVLYKLDKTVLADVTGSIEVTQGGGGVIPEPTTLALVASVLAALGVVARKRS